MPPIHCPQCASLLPPGTPVDCCPLCLGDEEPWESGGRVLGDCELFEEIGRGGMGVVWRGRQRGLDRNVAVKTLPGGDLAGAEARSRFRIEARATARLKHPNIVSIFDVGEADGMPYFVMELIEGRTLSATLADKPVPARQAARWLRDAALAVQHAHGQGVLHRDLKPSNLLIEPGPDGGQLRVTDFGLAQMTDADGGMTLSGSAVGSPSFMSPEQACGSAGTVAGDVYGLGAVLYHALTGRPPFQGESVAAVLAQVEKEDPLPPRRLSTTVPADLETVCLKCLEKSPARRYASAQDLADDLTRFLEGRPVLARPLGRLPKLLRLARRRPWEAATLGLVLTLIALGFWFLAWSVSTGRQHQQALLAEQAATSLALMKSQLGEGRSIVRLRQADSRPRALAIAASLTSQNPPPEIRQEARDLALSALALSSARTEPLTGAGVASDDWTMATADFAGNRWALAEFHGPVRIRPLDRAEDLFAFPTTPRKVTAMIRFSQDGRWLAMRHQIEMGVWDVSPEGRGKLVFTSDAFRNASFNFMKTAFHPDGKSVWCAGPDALVVNALPGGEELARWPMAVNAVALDPDGTRFVIAYSRSPLVEVRAWPGGGLLRQITGLPREAATVAICRGGDPIATGDVEGNLSIWHDTPGGQRLQRLPNHEEDLRGMIFDQNGRRLVSTSDDGTMRIHDILTDQTVVHMAFDIGIPALSPDGTQLAAGYASGTLSRAILTPPALLHRLRPRLPPDIFQQLSFSADGSSLFTLTGHGVTRLSLPEGKEMESISFHQPYSVLAQPGPEKNQLWIGGPDGLSLFPQADAKPRSLFGPVRWGWTSLCHTPDGRWVAVADCAGSRALVLDGRQPDPDHAIVLDTPNLGTGSLALSPDGKQLVAGFRYDRDLHLFDIASRKVTRILPFPPRHTLDWSPDGRWLGASGSSLMVWDTSTWQEQRLPALTANHPPNGAVAFAPLNAERKCAVMAMVTDNKRIALLSLPDFKTLAILEAPEGRPIYQMQFSPDAHWLAAACGGGEIQLWDLPAVLEKAREFTP